MESDGEFYIPDGCARVGGCAEDARGNRAGCIAAARAARVDVSQKAAERSGQRRGAAARRLPVLCSRSLAAPARRGAPMSSTSIGRNDLPLRCMNSRAAIVSTSLEVRAPVVPLPLEVSTFFRLLLMNSSSSNTSL
eukprot:2823347-Prymnesium_polylepis.1